MRNVSRGEWLLLKGMLVIMGFLIRQSAGKNPESVEDALAWSAEVDRSIKP